MHLLVDDLLDVTRIQQGRLELRTEPTDLATLAQQVVKHFEDAPERTPAHALVLDAPESVGNWDAFRLEQVLINLVSNALKYSPEGGEVRVRVRAIDGQAEVKVRDQGIGIAPAVQSRLFEPFSRDETAIGRRVKETGLGLTITRQILERHGGTIVVDSTPGVETVFTVRLPVTEPDEDRE